MKLRNKQTGEIRPAEAREDGIYLYDEITEQWYKYELDLLAKWWEYYEEPKEWWFIDCSGFIKHGEGLFTEKSYIKDIQAIGNYFETKEEAEKAVEKLKAWRRLKDKGLHVTTFYVEDGSLVIRAKAHNSSGAENWEDLNLLFSGEDN